MTKPDYRAMCAELVAAWDDLPWEYDFKGNVTGIHGDLCDDSAVDRARALLAQPVAEGPSDDELLRVAATAIAPYEISNITPGEYEPETECVVEAYGSELIAYARAALARWGHPQTPQPVAVSERLPGPEDCDVQGRCWMFGNVEGDWRLISATNSGIPQLKYCFSHWLPANALPTPEATND